MPEPQFGTELLSWTAYSRPFKPLDKQLFSVGIVIAVLLSIILASAGEWMLIIVIATLFFAYYSWSTYAPELTKYSLTSLGVHAHGKLYRYDQISRYWIEGNLIVFDTPVERLRRLYLVMDSKVAPDQIKSLLSKYLSYDQPQPTPLDRATAWLTRTFPLTK
jgi:hypothetical protein